MKLLLSMPGGSEWIIIIFFGGLIIAAPILAIYFYAKNRRLNEELKRANFEKDKIISNLLEKK